MKLVFPNREHAQTLLGPGVNRIGTAADGTVVLQVPSMPAVAAEIHVIGVNTNLIPHADAEVLVNDKPVSELIALRVGDRLRIAGIEIRLAGIAAGHDGAGAHAAPLEDPATRMMVAVTKYSLRGLNGTGFGKLYPVSGPIVIGRAPECDIILDLPEISRRHVQLRPTFDGVQVEDLGSSNGILINNQRMQHGILRPGDELCLHTNRFVLTAPGTDLATAPARLSAPAATRRKTMPRLTIASFAVGILIATVAIAWVLR